MHGQQCGDAVEARAVADAGGHRDDGDCGQATDHAGEGTLHAGCDDDRVGRGDTVEVGEQPVETGDADVGEPVGFEAVGAQREHGFVEHGHVGGAGADREHTERSEGLGQAPGHAARSDDALGMLGEHRLALVVVGAGEEHWTVVVFEHLGHDPRALLGRLPGSVDGLGQTLAQRAVVVHQRVADVGEWQPSQFRDRLVGRGGPRPDVVDQLTESRLVHTAILARPRRERLAGVGRPATTIAGFGRVGPKGRRDRLRPTRSLWAMTRIGFLGPLGTFTEQALMSQTDLAQGEFVLFRTMPDVLDAVESGEVDLGFVAIENSIEGMVNLSQDELAFSHDLLIQREVVLDIEHCLMAPKGTSIMDVKVVLSIPVATAQCHAFLRNNVGQAELRAANSTAEGARLASELGVGHAAVAPRSAAALYGLEILVPDIADHPGNQTRFVAVAREGVPAPTGHDRTALVIYQRADEPGSLISILQEFAARRINLSNLLSRPTKDGGLGDYCFIVYADGHIADELLADAVRALRAKQGRVKFLGSYPAAGEHAHEAREHADQRWREADDWVSSLRDQIRPNSPIEDIST